MPELPVRDLGGVGVVTDILPFETPVTTFYRARNVRFANGSLIKTPVFKKVDGGTDFSGTPIGIMDTSEPEDIGHLVVINSDGKVEELYNEAVTDVSPGEGLVESRLQPTTTSLSGVDYIAMEHNPPIHRTLSMTNFDFLPGWDELDSCKSFRAFGDFLLAINVRKGAINYPTMVKWSDAVQTGAPPQNWDTAADDSLAGENALNMDGELLDGVPLGNAFFLYGTEEMWRMQYVGGNFIFRFDPVFETLHTIGKNCVASNGDVHFVFAEDDIYIHDGVSKESLTQERIHDYLYDRLDKTRSDKFHVFHDLYANEVLFCYVTNSADAKVSSEDIDGCNEAAVYNYRSKTWSFIDLPSTVGGMFGTTNKSISWDDMGDWSEAEISWLSVEGRSPSIPLFLSTGAKGVPAGVFYRDRLTRGLVDVEVQSEFAWEGYAMSLYKDFDDVGSRPYATKLIRTVYPQVSLKDPDHTVGFQFGATAHSEQPIRWGKKTQFSPYDGYKIDSRMNGRLLSFLIDFPSDSHGEVSGFNLDLVETAGR